MLLSGLLYLPHFTNSDVMMTVIMGLCVSTVASGGSSFSVWKSIVYFTLYELSQTYINQISGAAEDCIRNPNRPIPRGLVTKQEAMIAWALIMMAFTVAGYSWNVLPATLLWQATLVAHNFGANKVAWSRNLSLALGYMSMFNAGLGLVAPSDSYLQAISIVLPACLFIGTQIQELQEQKRELNSGATLVVDTSS